VWWRLQGKLQGRLLEHSTPQPIDECLAILGDAIVRQNSLSPVMSVFAKAVKDGDVRPFQPTVWISLDQKDLLFHLH
jgi:hypothetical protein